jgi:PilZ domain
MSVSIESWVDPERSQRHFRRHAVLFSAELMALHLTWPCMILDISPRGAGVHLPAADHLEVGLNSHLRLFEFGSIESEVRHQEVAFVGLRFRHGGASDAQMVRWLEALHVG